MPTDAEERSPLLADATEHDDDDNDNNNTRDAAPTESSPLLASRQQSHTQDGAAPPSSGKKKRRWPSFIAITLLAAIIIVVMVLGFVIPPAVQKYVESAVVIEPTSLSVESLTADGVRARIQANFRLDASRVADDNARRIGRFTTGVMRKLGADTTTVRIRLPGYEDALLGTAVVPPITLDLVDGHVTDLDFVADVTPGNSTVMRSVVNDWLDGKLDRLKVTGATALRLKSGIFPLGTHDVVESMVFEAEELPGIPEYEIGRMAFQHVSLGDGSTGIGANVSVTTHNDYPVGLNIPPLGFEVFVPNCDASQPSIKVATAVTAPLQVEPEANVTVDAEGVIREIPESLTRACPMSKLSPLDNFVQKYLHGDDAEVLVRGKSPRGGDLPDWAGEIMESITVPVQFPGRSLDNFLRNYSLSDVDFKMPSPFADPKDPNSKPRVSGTVHVLAGLPADFNVDVQVDSLRATGDLYYGGEKFGELNLERWQKANSTIQRDVKNNESLLNVESRIVDAPIEITDGDIFSNIMQELFFGDDDVVLDVVSNVDVKVSTVLGRFTVQGVPAKGKVPVKHVPGDTLRALNPQVGDLRVINTSATGVHIRASVDFVNPTDYAASIPYMSIHVLERGEILGEAIARDLRVEAGNNTDNEVEAIWDPSTYGGEESQRAAQRLLSEYLSGKNTTITLRTHKGSIPTVPLIGQALSKLNITVSTPKMHLPPGDGDEHDGFIRDATFHLLTSRATFTLASPLRHDTIWIEHINATAYYNHTEPVGQIIHDEAFYVPPGLSTTPKLPVTWSVDNVGYDKLKAALGGTLKLDAYANVTVRLGDWVETVNYEGKGIGARVSL